MSRTQPTVNPEKLGKKTTPDPQKIYTKIEKKYHKTSLLRNLIPVKPNVNQMYAQVVWDNISPQK